MSEAVKILVLDDEPAHLLITVRALKRLPSPSTQILQARNEQEALRLTEAHADVSVFVVDLNLAGQSGLSFVSKLRGMCSFAKSPIIAVSTSGLESDVEDSYAAGATLFLRKDNDPSVFQSQIIQAVSALLRTPPA
jgi:CheY-like chemotaxis protein